MQYVLQAVQCSPGVGHAPSRALVDGKPRVRGLQEDLQRGAFDDFRELRETEGKLWRSPERLLPAQAARPFPSIQVGHRSVPACWSTY